MLISGEKTRLFDSENYEKIPNRAEKSLIWSEIPDLAMGPKLNKTI